MTNGDRAQKMLTEAKDLVQDLERAWQKENWNRCIRRAQEIVELVLKGLLSQMSIDYPKWNDVGEVFARAVQEHHLTLEADFLKWLNGFSEKLAEERAPAFYFEEDYSQEDAMQAKEGALRVLTFGQTFLETLRNK